MSFQIGFSLYAIFIFLLFDFSLKFRNVISFLKESMMQR